MKKRITVIALVLTVRLSAMANDIGRIVTTNAPWCVVTLQMDKQVYIPGEEVVAWLSISNASPDRISFTSEYFPMKTFSLHYQDGAEVSITEYQRNHLTGMALGQHGFRKWLESGEQVGFRQAVNLIYDTTLSNTYTLTLRMGVFRKSEVPENEVALQMKQCVFTVEGELMIPRRGRKE